MDIEVLDHNDMMQDVTMGIAHFPLADIPVSGSVRKC